MTKRGSEILYIKCRTCNHPTEDIDAALRLGPDLNIQKLRKITFIKVCLRNKGFVVT